MVIKFLKPFSFLPAILLMYMIFSFSSQDGTTSASLSYQVSYKIVEVGGEVLGADLQPWEVDKLATRFHIPVRKLAHMTEYFLLAVSVAFPLYVYGLRGILLLIAAGVICVAFACGDEYHQAFVDGRGPSKRDVLIDSIGVFFGIILVRIIGWTGRKTIFRPFSRKKKQESAATADPYMADPRRNDPRMTDPRINDSRMANSRMNDSRHMEDPRRNDPRMAGSNNPNYAPYHSDRQDPSHYDPARYSPYPQTEAGAYHGEPYYNEPSPNESYHNNPYRDDPYSNGPYPDEPYRDDPYSNGPYPNEPYRSDSYYDDPYYDEVPYPDEDAAGTSDRLSEDMSLRKLVTDLKDQKQARRAAQSRQSARKPASGRTKFPPLP